MATDKNGKSIELGDVVLGHGDNVKRTVCGPAVAEKANGRVLVAHATPIALGEVASGAIGIVQVSLDDVDPTTAEVIG
jgi:hypothetical protein